MEQAAIQHNPKELLARFNDVLGQHMERLLGFKLGPAGMPLTVTTLACLALLSERVDDLKGSDTEAPYSSEDLLAELSDLGLKEYGDCVDILRQLKEKAYVRSEREGGIMPNPVALRLEELLDRIFPKMPGLNFVAYVTQTIGEVKTGRKALAPALSQFDQTLTMQGVSVVKRKTATPSEGRPPAPQKEPQPVISPPQTPFPSRPRQEPNPGGLKTHRPSEAQGPRVLGSAAPALHSEVREFTIGELASDSEESPEPVSAAATESARASNHPEPEEAPDLTEPVHSVPSVDRGEEIEIAEEAGDEPFTAAEAGENASPSFDGPEDETGDDLFSDQAALPAAQLDEKSVQDQVLAFEEELSLRCPTCNKGHVEANTTPTGRTYYKCNGQDCHFVSWGRPVHHPCPRCKNPFLIQISDKSGRTAYKCPRATCHYVRLTGDGGAVTGAGGMPMRKVVRRRVVRRKR